MRLTYCLDRATEYFRERGKRMCTLVDIRDNTNNVIKVADIKADIIKKIIDFAQACSKIDYIFLFGSALEERCKVESDIDLAIVSNVTRSKLFRDRSYDTFTSNIYNIEQGQDYDILQFNSLNALNNGKNPVCNEILNGGRIIYTRRGIYDV